MSNLPLYWSMMLWNAMVIGIFDDEILNCLVTVYFHYEGSRGLHKSREGRTTTTGRLVG